MIEKQLWLVRPLPRGENRLAFFIEKSIIQVGWNNIGDLSNCKTREDVRHVVDQVQLEPRDANLKVGLHYNFAIQMKIGDYCIIPNEDYFYVAVITGEYEYIIENELHTRTVKFLNNREIYARKEELPEALGRSIKSRLALANLTTHIELFLSFLENKNRGTSVSMMEKMQILLPKAVEIIEEELESDDKYHRLLAAMSVIYYSK